MSNPYRMLLDLLPDEPLLVGEVTSISDGVATIELPGGGVTQARGDATVGQNVYFRGGAIESVAPALTIEVIEV
jgi:hypothetical protein